MRVLSDDHDGDDDGDDDVDQKGNSSEARYGGWSIKGGMSVGLMMSNCCAYNKLPPPSMLVS